MEVLNIHFFPAEQEKNKYLGAGYVSSGGLKARFTVWRNDKFAKGFSVSFPFSKKTNGEVMTEVEFFNRDASDEAYNKIEAKLIEAGLLGNGGGNTRTTTTTTTRPATPTRTTQAVPVQRAPNPQGGAPRRVPF